MKEKALSNLLWKFAERCGAQSVSFVVSIILARILGPESYGTIALITVITGILQVFVDSGLGNALIQEENAGDVEFSTVFYFNIFIGMVFYVLLFLAAPLIANFYNNEDLKSLIRVLGLVLIISGLKNVQQAYVSKKLMFKCFFYATLGGTLGAAVIGIVLAYMGGGAWALVAQYLFNVGVDTAILWWTVKWRPRKVFSFKHLKNMLSFGWKLMITNLITTVYYDLQQLFIGKVYSASSLAYYNRGRQFPWVIIMNVNSSIDGVMFPIMSMKQKDKDTIRNYLKYSIGTSTYIIAPLMTGLFAIAPSLIEVLLTDKWWPCVSYLRIFSMAFLLYPMCTANLNALKAMGMSEKVLKLEMIRTVMGIAILLCTMRMGVKYIAYGVLLESIIRQYANSIPIKKVLGYGYWEQIKDFVSNVYIAIIMMFLVMSINLLNMSSIWKLVIQIITGICVYVGISWGMKNRTFLYIVDIIKGMIFKNRK